MKCGWEELKPELVMRNELKCTERQMPSFVEMIELHVGAKLRPLSADGVLLVKTVARGLCGAGNERSTVCAKG
jgi:hypothetical protein